MELIRGPRAGSREVHEVRGFVATRQNASGSEERRAVHGETRDFTRVIASCGYIRGHGKKKERKRKKKKKRKREKREKKERLRPVLIAVTRYLLHVKYSNQNLEFLLNLNFMKYVEYYGPC